MNRREALRAGALAVAGLAVAPARARGAVDEGALLLGLWRRETAAAYAYGVAGMPTLAGHERDHAAALATELAAVGLGTPKPPATVEALDIAAQLLAQARDEAAAIALEEGLVEVYRAAVPALPDVKIAMTAATILASHAQHLLILRRHAGSDPLASA